MNQERIKQRKERDVSNPTAPMAIKLLETFYLFVKSCFFGEATVALPWSVIPVLYVRLIR